MKKLKTIKSKNRGFTIVELMIVMMVIAILFALVFISTRAIFHDRKLNQAKGALETLKTAVEQYYNQYGTYPGSLADLTTTSPVILRVLPKDPFSASGAAYQYVRGYEYVSTISAGGSTWTSGALPSDNDLKWLRTYFYVYSVGGDGAANTYWDWPAGGQHKPITTGDDIFNYGTAAAPKIPDRLREAGRLSMMGDLNDIQGQDNYLYLATGLGLSIVNISTPYAPSLAGGFAIPGGALGIAVAGRYAYLGGGNLLTIVDISDPASPSLAGSYDASGDGGAICDVFVSENYAYVLTRDRLLVIDISNPAAPELRGTTGAASFAAGIYPHLYVEGKYAYVAAYQSDGGEGRLKIWDISSVSIPLPAGSLIADVNIGADEFEIVVEGKYGYMADGDFRVLDLSNPAAPSSATSSGPTGWLRYICVSGNYAYCADHDHLRVYNISKPNLPSEVPNSLLAYSNYINCLAVKGNYAFLAVNGPSKIVVIHLF